MSKQRIIGVTLFLTTLFLSILVNLLSSESEVQQFYNANRPSIYYVMGGLVVISVLLTISGISKEKTSSIDLVVHFPESRRFHFANKIILVYELLVDNRSPHDAIIKEIYFGIRFRKIDLLSLIGKNEFILYFGPGDGLSSGHCEARGCSVFEYWWPKLKDTVKARLFKKDSQEEVIFNEMMKIGSGTSIVSLELFVILPEGVVYNLEQSGYEMKPIAAHVKLVDGQTVECKPRYFPSLERISSQIIIRIPDLLKD